MAFYYLDDLLKNAGKGDKCKDTTKDGKDGKDCKDDLAPVAWHWSQDAVQ